MAEVTIPSQLESPQPAPEEQQLAGERAAEFVAAQVPVLSKLTGLNVQVAVGEGWATDMQTGNFTVDPSYFTDKDYSPEYAAHTCFHELLAHVRDAVRDPVYAARQRAFGSQGKAQHLFNNILTDIQGDKYTAKLLPAMANIGVSIYDNKLFPLEQDGQAVDYAGLPLHVQFMYKMIRQEMVPGSETPVRPEVDAALARLRDFQGSGVDMIGYLTEPNPKLAGNDRLDQQLAIIYPEYLALLEQAKQEASEEQSGQGQSGEQNEESQGGQAEPQPQDGTPGRPNSEQTPSDEELFSEAYDDYFTNKHPEPLSEEQEKQLDQMIKKAAKEQQQAQQAPNPTRELDHNLRQETGFGLREHQAYQADIAKHRDAIDAMRNVFRSVIAERVAQRRGLSRNAYTEGDLLDPNRLPQLIIDKKSGVHQPEAFVRYEQVKGRAELVGKTDYMFVFDRSDSMGQDGRSAAAATSALIMLEALSAMERDIKQAEEQNNVELDLDIRTALYVFDSTATCLKPLSEGLSDRERLSVQSEVSRPRGSTADYLALQEIDTVERSSDRRRIVIVVSDGESNEVQEARSIIQKLRASGDTVYGIGIGSNDATALYAPYGTRVDNPDDLPGVLQSYIESTW